LLSNGGGDECAILYAGKDGTDDFEEIGHSNTAKEMLESYYIGEYEVRFVVCFVMWSLWMSRSFSDCNNEDGCVVLHTCHECHERCWESMFAGRRYGSSENSERAIDCAEIGIWWIRSFSDTCYDAVACDFTSNNCVLPQEIMEYDFRNVTLIQYICICSLASSASSCQTARQHII